MKELIKEILKDYHNQIKSIRIISDSEYNLFEQYENLTPRELVTPELKKKVNSYLEEKYPIKGVVKYKDGKKSIYTFKIVFTEHWYERLFRKNDPEYKEDPNIVNPDYRETIDLIVKGANKLAKFLDINKIT